MTAPYKADEIESILNEVKPRDARTIFDGFRKAVSEIERNNQNNQFSFSMIYPEQHWKSGVMESAGISFSDEEIEAAKNHPEHFLGVRMGVGCYLCIGI